MVVIHSDKPYVRDGVIVGFATGIFGIAFGVLAISADLSVAQTMVMSLFVFTGASQFAAVGVIAAGGSPATAIGSALLLAARNGLYSMTMSPHISGSLGKRALAAHITIDESTALGTAQDEPADVAGAFWVGGVSVFVFWNLGTLIGALGGQAIGDPNALGLDAAFPAGFISLAAGSLRHQAGRIAAVTGFTIAIIAVPFTQAGVPILLAAGGAVIALAIAGPSFLATSDLPATNAETNT